jgi:uncharacterized protein YbjQ (UPF0145 family)
VDEQESLERIEQGGIPLAAERRLSELREDGSLFTSDLSVNGWALCHQLGLRPLSQVMGSSIYQMGYQESWGQMGGWDPLGANMIELDTLSRALNEVRSRALRRLAEEARQVGAAAVVGVNTSAGESQLETGSVALEHLVIGTAVRREGANGRAPVLTELSVADYAKLLRAGFEPMGIVAWSSVFFASYALGPAFASGAALRSQGLLGPVRNYELQEFTQAFYEARETVMWRLTAQAASLGASGIVGMKIGHVAVPRKLGGGVAGQELSGLMVTFNAIGTAIHQTEDAPLYPPETAIDLTT